MQANYDANFYAYADRNAETSAPPIIECLLRWFRPTSVLDVGCGPGTWLQAWTRAGATDVVGVDGAPGHDVLLPTGRYVEHDLEQPFDLGRTFDLAQCLECAEHLTATGGHRLVQSLAAHSTIVLFSAAPPGQGGRHHINERPYEYWRDTFAAHRFVAVDAVRPRIQHRRDVRYWYRYNLLLFVHEGRMSSLPQELHEARIPPTERIPEFAPLPHRVRRMALRALPGWLQDKLSRARDAGARRFLRE